MRVQECQEWRRAELEERAKRCETFGRLDYAFNNAATSDGNRLFVDQTEENFNRVFAVNVKAL